MVCPLQNQSELLYKNTQVGSPAVRLKLARCTAWVKQWSEAMDFLQTIFKTNIFLLRIFENYYTKNAYLESKVMQKLQKLYA